MFKVFASILLALLGAVPLAAQDDPLIGRWRGVSADNQDEDLRIQADGTAISDGDRLRWRRVRQGVLEITGPEQAVEMRYSVRGSRLTLNFLGESYVYERVGQSPAPQPREGQRPAEGNPLGGPVAGNPLGGGDTPIDPWVRRYEGEAIAIELAADGEAYRGTLTFQGKDYPATARGDGRATLRGRFEVAGTVYEFTATRDGDLMQIASGGSNYQLRAVAPAAPAGNPLGDGGAPGPAPLEGVSPERGAVWEHPRGWFTFEMPRGWSVSREAPEGILLNPGLTENDTLDAIIFLTFGRLDADERNQPVDRVLMSNEAELQASLREQGIEVGRAGQPPRKVSVGEIPGAIQTWSGRAQSGVKVDVWVGALIKREAYLVVMAVLVDGKGARFLPEIKRVFQTLRPTPPEPNPQLTRALTGASFAHTSNTESGSFSTIYTFRPGAVHQQMMFSGSDAGGMNSEETGRFEVVGDEVFLYFSGGQSSGQIVQADGRITALRFGDAVYSRR